jgi:hypothetical protein
MPAVTPAVMLAAFISGIASSIDCSALNDIFSDTSNASERQMASSPYKQYYLAAALAPQAIGTKTTIHKIYESSGAKRNKTSNAVHFISFGGTINSRTIAYVEGHTNLPCNTTLKPRSTTIYHNGQNKS